MQTLKTTKASVTKEEARKILSEVPYNDGFHFATSVSKYAGETAINLFSFYEILRNIDSASVKFHAQRRDFQKWIDQTLGDKLLAEKLDSIGASLPDQELRQEIRKAVSNRIQELQAIT